MRKTSFGIGPRYASSVSRGGINVGHILPGERFCRTRAACVGRYAAVGHFLDLPVGGMNPQLGEVRRHTDLAVKRLHRRDSLPRRDQRTGSAPLLSEVFPAKPVRVFNRLPPEPGEGPAGRNRPARHADRLSVRLFGQRLPGEAVQEGVRGHAACLSEAASVERSLTPRTVEKGSRALSQARLLC